MLREYERQRDAALDLHVSQSCICNAVNGRIPSANGYLVSYKGAPFVSPDDAASAVAQLESKKRALPHEQPQAAEDTGRKLRRKTEGSKKLPQFNTLRSGVIVAILNFDGTGFDTQSAESTCAEAQISVEVAPDNSAAAMEDEIGGNLSSSTTSKPIATAEVTAPVRSRRASAKKQCHDGHAGDDDDSISSSTDALPSASTSETAKGTASSTPQPPSPSLPPPPGAVTAATFFAHLPPWRSLVVREHPGPSGAPDSHLPPLQTRRLSVWECRAPSLGEPGGPKKDAAWVAKQQAEQQEKKTAAQKAACDLAVNDAWRLWARTEGPRAEGAAAGGRAMVDDETGAEEDSTASAHESLPNAPGSKQSPQVQPMEVAWREWAKAEGPRAAGAMHATPRTAVSPQPPMQQQLQPPPSTSLTSSMRPWPRMCPLERKRLVLALEAVMTTPTAEPFLEIPVEKRRRKGLGRPRSDASVSFAAKVASAVDVVAGSGSKRKKQTLGSQPKKAQKGLDNTQASVEVVNGQEEVEENSEGHGDNFLPYDAVVAGPISLELILSRLRMGRYRHYSALVADLQRIYFNAAEYNASGSEIVRRARMLIRLALGLFEASRGAAPSKAHVNAATARAAAAAAANKSTNKEALTLPSKAKTVKHRSWQAHLRALAAMPTQDSNLLSGSTTSSSSSSSSSATTQSSDAGQLIDRALAAALRDSVAYRTTAHDAREDAYATSIVSPPVDDASTTSAHLTSDAWLHSSTAVLAELAMAKALWDSNAPSAASAAALHVLDVYGGWDLLSSSAGSSGSKDRALRKQAVDLSFEEMESTMQGSSTQAAAGGGGGGASEANADGTRKRSVKELKRERRAERERLGLPARIPGRPYSSLIQLPPKPGDSGVASAVDGGKSSSTQPPPLSSEEEAIPASTVRRDFGPPHGVFFGTVMTYVTPYYLVQYPDGDTEDMAPSDILRLRVPEASGLDPSKFGGHRRRLVTLRMGAGTSDGAAQDGSKGGLVAHTIAQLPPLPSEEAEVDALI